MVQYAVQDYDMGRTDRRRRSLLGVVPGHLRVIRIKPINGQPQHEMFLERHEPLLHFFLVALPCVRSINLGKTVRLRKLVSARNQLSQK